MVVKALDGSDQDAATLKMLGDGIGKLDSAAGGSFVNANEDARLAAAKAIEGTPFFETVRGTTVGNLYNNPIAFAHFGYQGSAWEHGGYKHRGFDDLTWAAESACIGQPGQRLRGADNMANKFEYKDESVVVVVGSGGGRRNACE